MRQTPIALALTFVGLTSLGFAQATDTPPAPEQRVPNAAWSRYATPEEAGFSSEALAKTRAAWEATQSAGYMVVYRGAVVVAWGDLERRFMCHSVRKSFLSALIGQEVMAGRLSLDQTMAELDITDDGVDGEGLTVIESAATVHDLLRARSGVYRLAAYEPPQNPKPARGTYGPNEFWCYNNWDFNTLLTIFEAASDARIFEAFDQRVARPIGMQDYRPRDGYYHFEREKSQHPAYPFRMSGRDMARYGLLFLNRGLWNGEQVIPESWVEASRTQHSTDGVWGGGGYGYMWWTSGEPRLAELGSYSARGVGGQLIQVLPGADLVIVNRTNTFLGHAVGQDTLDQLALSVLAAQTGTPADEPKLVPLPETGGPTSVALPEHVRRRLTRRWDTWDGVEIRAEGETLVLESLARPGMCFDLIPIGQSDDQVSFVLEGMGEGFALQLGPDSKGDVLLSEDELNLKGYEQLRAGDTEAALAIFERNAELFPTSANVWDSLGEGRLEAGDLDGALAAYERSLELNPHSQSGPAAIERIEAQRVPSGG